MFRLLRVVGLALAILVIAVLLLGNGGLLARGEQALPWSAEAAALARVPTGVAYVANEGSGTITVVNTRTSAIAATICLGSDPAIPNTPQPNGPCNADTQSRMPYYNGHDGPSSLSLTPDGSVLLVANRLSNTVAAVDTATRSVLGYTPVGLEPAVAAVRPGVFGRARWLEAWVAIRGERQLDVLRLDHDELYDARLRRTERIQRVASVDTVLGPSTVAFTSDGRFAFVVGGKEGRVDKLEASTRSLAAYRFLDSPWTSFALVTPDDRELYLVQKGANRISVLRADDLEPVAKDVEVGSRPGQVRFVGGLAYITVAGPTPTAANPNPSGKVVVLDRRTHRVVRELTGSAFSGEPGALWATPEGRLYVALERGNRVMVVATGDPDDPSDDLILGTVTGSAGELSYLKRPVAIVANP